MMHLDLDRDGKNDEEQTEIIPVTPQLLVEFGLVSSAECAESLLEHFTWVCPAMAIGHVAEDRPGTRGRGYRGQVLVADG
jgi:hypothetical protein